MSAQKDWVHCCAELLTHNTVSGPDASSKAGTNKKPDLQSTNHQCTDKRPSKQAAINNQMKGPTKEALNNKVQQVMEQKDTNRRGTENQGTDPNHKTTKPQKEPIRYQGIKKEPTSSKKSYLRFLEPKVEVIR